MKIVRNIIARNDDKQNAHIYVYGEINYEQTSHASEWGIVNLKDVKNQYDRQKEAENIIVHIHSPGGFVSEGFAIHDYLRSLDKPIATIIEGTCASIATVVALAGDTRLMTSNASFFVHNPWGVAIGDQEDIKKYGEELEKLENQIAGFYASKTHISKEEALSLMKEETTLSSEDALEKGFITKIEETMRAVALFAPEKQLFQNDKKTIKTKNQKTGIMNLLNKIKNMLGENEKEISLTLADGEMITVISDTEEPKEGDEVKDKDGNKLSDGTYLFKENKNYALADRTKFEVKSGKIEKITPPEPDKQNSDLSEMETRMSALEDLVKTQNKVLKELAANIDVNEQKILNVKKLITSKNYDLPTKASKNLSSKNEEEKTKESRIAELQARQEEYKKL